MRWLDNIIDSMGMNLSKLFDIVEDRGAGCAAVHGVTKSQTWLSEWTITKATQIILSMWNVFFMLRGLQRTLPSCNIYFSILVRISFADFWDIFYWNYFLWGFIYKFKKELWNINVGFKKCLDGFHYGISLYGLKHLLKLPPYRVKSSYLPFPTV